MTVRMADVPGPAARKHYDVLVVGTGPAGVHLALALESGGFAGHVGVLGRERCFPYDRPPLSKAYLSGLPDAEDLEVRTREFWNQSRVELQLGAEIVAVDADRHTARTATGDQVSYGVLAWAAGGSARSLRMDGGTLPGVFRLRSLEDAQRLRSAVSTARHAVIVGAGYIGLEAAAAFVARGLDVTVVESADRVLSRVTCPDVSTYFLDLHRHHGVRVVLDATAESLTGTRAGVTGVRLTTGQTMPADVVLVGTGMDPECDVLRAAGAQTADGLITDAYNATTLPDVYALGDCAQTPTPFAAGARLRVESIQNAVDQAKSVAAGLLGDPRPYTALPWFWSHQYDVKLQSAGIAFGHDTRILRGSPSRGVFSVVYLRGDQLVAIDAVNCTRDYTHGRHLLQRRARLDLARAADDSLPLRAAIKDAPLART